MNKLLPATGAVGASMAAAGGYMFLGKGSESNATKVSETFTERYSKAVLSDGDPLWDIKLTALEGNGSPVHTTLIEAKSTAQKDKARAKQLLVEGCKDIYTSQLESSLYANDFKSYCAKTIKDGINKKWISEDPNGDGTTWETILLSFERHNENEHGLLSDGLRDLKNKMDEAKNQFKGYEGRKQILSTWCNTSQGEIFMGDEDPRFVQSGLYCVEMENF